MINIIMYNNLYQVILVDVVVVAVNLAAPAMPSSVASVTVAAPADSLTLPAAEEVK